jgi:hypothetical protein
VLGWRCLSSPSSWRTNRAMTGSDVPSSSRCCSLNGIPGPFPRYRIPERTGPPVRSDFEGIIANAALVARMPGRGSRAWKPSTPPRKMPWPRCSWASSTRGRARHPRFDS